MADFTPTQGRYLAFIHAYTNLHGYPPAESEIAAAMCVSPPSVNQMVKMLEKKGLILRQPGQPRSLQVLVPEDEIPAVEQSQAGGEPGGRRQATEPRCGDPAAPPANLYVLSVFLMSGPISEKFANKEDQPRHRDPRRPDARTTASRHLRGVRPLGRSICTNSSSANVRSIPTGPNYGVPDRAHEEERRRRRTHDKAGRPGSEAGVVSSVTGSTSATTGFIRFRSSGSSKPSRPSPTRASSSEWANLRRNTPTNSGGQETKRCRARRSNGKRQFFAATLNAGPDELMNLEDKHETQTNRRRKTSAARAKEEHHDRLHQRQAKASSAPAVD